MSMGIDQYDTSHLAVQMRFVDSLPDESIANFKVDASGHLTEKGMIGKAFTRVRQATFLAKNPDAIKTNLLKKLIQTHCKIAKGDAAVKEIMHQYLQKFNSCGSDQAKRSFCQNIYQEVDAKRYASQLRTKSEHLLGQLQLKTSDLNENAEIAQSILHEVEKDKVVAKEHGGGKLTAADREFIMGCVMPVLVTKTNKSIDELSGIAKRGDVSNLAECRELLDAASKCIDKSVEGFVSPGMKAELRSAVSQLQAIEVAFVQHAKNLSEFEAKVDVFAERIEHASGLGELNQVLQDIQAEKTVLLAQTDSGIPRELIEEKLSDLSDRAIAAKLKIYNSRFESLKPIAFSEEDPEELSNLKSKLGRQEAQVKKDRHIPEGEKNRLLSEYSELTTLVDVNRTRSLVRSYRPISTLINTQQVVDNLRSVDARAKAIDVLKEKVHKTPDASPLKEQMVDTLAIARSELQKYRGQLVEQLEVFVHQEVRTMSELDPQDKFIALNKLSARLEKSLDSRDYAIVKEQIEVERRAICDHIALEHIQKSAAIKLPKFTEAAGSVKELESRIEGISENLSNLENLVKEARVFGLEPSKAVTDKIETLRQVINLMNIELDITTLEERVSSPDSLQRLQRTKTELKYYAGKMKYAESLIRRRRDRMENAESCLPYLKTSSIPMMGKGPIDALNERAKVALEKLTASAPQESDYLTLFMTFNILASLFAARSSK